MRVPAPIMTRLLEKGANAERVNAVSASPHYIILLLCITIAIA